VEGQALTKRADTRNKNEKISHDLDSSKFAALIKYISKHVLRSQPTFTAIRLVTPICHRNRRTIDLKKLQNDAFVSVQLSNSLPDADLLNTASEVVD